MPNSGKRCRRWANAARRRSPQHGSAVLCRLLLAAARPRFSVARGSGRATYHRLSPRRGENGTMNLDQAVNIEDLHRMAKRRLPKIAFDFIEGGLEDERGLERNTSAFHKHRLLPRYLVDVSRRDQSQTLFGRTYSSPFGMSPTGAAESHLLRTGSAA